MGEIENRLNRMIRKKLVDKNGTDILDIIQRARIIGNYEEVIDTIAKESLSLMKEDATKRAHIILCKAEMDKYVTEYRSDSIMIVANIPVYDKEKQVSLLYRTRAQLINNTVNGGELRNVRKSIEEIVKINNKRPYAVLDMQYKIEKLFGGIWAPGKIEESIAMRIDDVPMIHTSRSYVILHPSRAIYAEGRKDMLNELLEDMSEGVSVWKDVSMGMIFDGLQCEAKTQTFNNFMPSTRYTDAVFSAICDIKKRLNHNK